MWLVDDVVLSIGELDIELLLLEVAVGTRLDDLVYVRRGDVFAGRGPAGALCLRVIEFAVSRRCRCAAASGTQRRVEGRSLGASSLSPVRELRACEWLPHPDPGLGLCWASGCGCKARQAQVWLEACETPTAACLQGIRIADDA